ncbi:hypothetical protein BU17DRAFT_99461 [Hysterangium stoloniferum]|nr:hypothetical protein BU17DRAFT_99461 [Hysterangium stoloniferum]
MKANPPSSSYDLYSLPSIGRHPTSPTDSFLVQDSRHQLHYSPNKNSGSLPAKRSDCFRLIDVVSAALVYRSSPRAAPPKYPGAIKDYGAPILSPGAVASRLGLRFSQTRQPSIVKKLIESALSNSAHPDLQRVSVRGVRTLANGNIIMRTHEESEANAPQMHASAWALLAERAAVTMETFEVNTISDAIVADEQTKAWSLRGICATSKNMSLDPPNAIGGSSLATPPLHVPISMMKHYCAAPMRGSSQHP